MFSTACYLNDIVNLAIASRTVREPAVENQLALIRHQVEEHGYWHENWCIDRYVELARIEEDEFHSLMGSEMCLSHGIRPGEDWLGNTECGECYSEH